MNRKKLAVAISGITLLSAVAIAGSTIDERSTVTIGKDNSARVDKFESYKLPGQSGYLNPANEEDFAVIMEHLSYADTTPAESPMFYKMVQEARTEALMQPQLYTNAVANVLAEETLHHSVLMPKTFQNTTTDETRLINSATVNVMGTMAFGYTTVVLKDSEGTQIGIPGTRRTFASEANRSVALADVDSAYIASNYDENDVFTLESVAMTQTTSGDRQFHKMTNQFFAKALMAKSSDGSDNGNIQVYAPTQSAANEALGAPNIKICLNRDHGDCDIPQLYPSNTPNADLKIKMPLQGEIETYHKITKIYEPGEGQSVLIGTETGAWIMAGNASAEGEWASMRNPTNGNTLIDYIEMEHFIDDEGFVGTRLFWDVPQEQAIFGVGADTTGTLFKRFENVQWEIRIEVAAETTIDMDFDLSTTDDQIVLAAVDTAFVAENADVDSTHSDWVLPEKLLHLYFEYSCVAEGTLISMSDGTTKKIEEVLVGELVATATGVKKVQDTSIGYEAIPMIDVTDSLGNNVLLTETHPVVTARGVVWASELVEGDVLSTDAGTSTVVSVSEELFNGSVHNLELEPAAGEDEAQETMYANGIAIGDLGYQSDLTFKDKAPTTVDSVLKALPTEWHQDYLNSLN
jgi:hypothetical protein